MKKLLLIAAAGACTWSMATEANTKVCAGCHGADFEKKAMNVSKVVKDMSKEDIIKALKGYQEGTYGGSMKSVMVGQVKNLNEADIEAIADKIAGGNSAADTAKSVAVKAVDAAKSQATDAAKAAADKAVEAAKDKAKEVAIDAAKKMM